MGKINQKWLDKVNGEYLKNSKLRVVRHALLKNELNQISLVQERNNDVQMRFSIDIPTMEVTNQKASGRCWIFAGLNLLREILAKKYNIENFEFSQNYVAFYDKLEKINWYMESVLSLLDVDKDDRTLVWLNQTGIQDGGQWTMFVNIIEKYGLVSKDAMPETTSSSNTRTMNEIINLKLRKFCAQARHLHVKKKDEEIKTLRENTLKELYDFLATCFGLPPQVFDFEYVSKDKKYHLEKEITPLDFYHKYLGEDLKNYVSIVNSPTEDKPFNKTFTIEYIGNVVGGDPIKHLNLDMKDFKKIVANQLKNKECVWFGSDCSKDGLRQLGVWDDKVFAYDDTFDMDLSLSKEDMLDYRHSAMNHAMLLTGVNIDKNKTTKWKIENSWGKESGQNGYYVCSDSWFDRYVYQAVVHKKYLTKSQLELLEKKPIKLSPWDPMGTLAD